MSIADFLVGFWFLHRAIMVIVHSTRVRQGDLQRCRGDTTRRAFCNELPQMSYLIKSKIRQKANGRIVPDDCSVWMLNLGRASPLSIDELLSDPLMNTEY